MEAVQQDKDAAAKSRAFGESHMEDDGHEPKTQTGRARAGEVRLALSVIARCISF